MRPILLVLPLALGGCSLAQETTSAYAGLGVGATTAGVTGSALLGVGVGALASWGVAEIFEYYDVRARAEVQSAIAAAAADLAPGQAAPWTTEKVSGQVEVMRMFGGITKCKEILYSVEAVENKRYSVGTVCKLDETWQWAASEPPAKW